MKILFLIPCFLSIMSFSNAEYKVKFPLEQLSGGSLPTGSIIFNGLANEETEDDEIDYPSTSSDIVINMFNGSLISGTHPQINNILLNYGDDIIYYTINSKEPVNVQYEASYNDENTPIDYAILSNSSCNKIGNNNYNCIFTLTASPSGLDGGGTTLNTYINDYQTYPFIYQLHLKISN